MLKHLCNSCTNVSTYTSTAILSSYFDVSLEFKCLRCWVVELSITKEGIQWKGIIFFVPEKVFSSLAAVRVPMWATIRHMCERLLHKYIIA